MSEFSKTEEFAFRKYIRSIIRKTDKLTKTQKEITLYMVNLWFYHRSGPKPFIHPSNGLISRKIKCDKRTVIRCTKFLVDERILIKVGNASKAGKRANEYVVNIEKLVCLFDEKGVTNVTSAFRKMSPQHSDKMSPRISNVETDDKSFKHDDGRKNVIYLGKVRA